MELKDKINRAIGRTPDVELSDDKNRFNVVYQRMLAIRWRITLVTLLSMFSIMVGISTSIVMGTRIVQEWKEIMLFMLGAFIGSYNRVFDYWFNNSQRDDKLIEKMDQENDSADLLRRKLELASQKGGEAAEQPIIVDMRKNVAEAAPIPAEPTPEAPGAGSGCAAATPEPAANPQTPSVAG